MSNNLVYALSKIEFGRITDSKFKESSDVVREALRKKYPVFLPNTEVRVIRVQVTPQGQETTQSVIPTIMLTSPSKDWGIRISPENILLHTNNYQSFDEFEARMRHVLNVVSQAMPIYHTSFVGIRYVNTFQYDKDTEFTSVFGRRDFLQPPLEGMMMVGSNLLSKYQTDGGWLNINSGVRVNNPKLPADIIEFATDLGGKNDVLPGPWAHLDIDSFSAQEGMVEYDLDKVMSQLSSLRSHAKSAYEQIIVENASNSRH